MAASSSDTLYYYTYNVAGADVTETFKVRHYVDGPSQMYGQGDFVARLSVISEATTCAEFPDMNSNDTNFAIGLYGDTRVDTYTSPGDYFQQVIWDGTYLEPGGLQLDIGWSYAIPTTGVSFAISYSNSETYYANSYQSFDNSGSSLVRQAGVIWNQDSSTLEDVGHNYDHSFTINKYQTTGTKYFKAKFTYDISNAQDYTYGGTKYKTMSVTYYCN